MHGRFETVDQRPALRFERRIAHPIESVWRAVTEPDELDQWFPSAVEVDLRVGGAMKFTFPETVKLDNVPSTMAGEVTDLEPPRIFAFYWGGDHLRFELEPADGGDACLLRFTVLLDDRAKAARDAAGWHVCLDTLLEHLDGMPTEAPGSRPSSLWRTHYEEYERLGMPTGAAVPGD